VLKRCQVSSQEHVYFSRYIEGGLGALCVPLQAQKLKKSPGKIGLITIQTSGWPERRKRSNKSAFQVTGE